MTTKTIGSGTTLSSGYGAVTQTGFSLTNQGVVGAVNAAYGIIVETTGDAIYNSGKFLADAVFAKGIFSDLSVRVTNFSGGTISGGYGLYLLGGGTVSNASGALITGALPIEGEIAGVQLRNQGAITGTGTSASQAGVLLKAGGYVYNMFGGSITGPTGVYEGVSATVRNAGSINGSSSAQGDGGVSLNAGGAVTNASKAGHATAAITSAYAAVFSRNKSAYVYNNALISGAAVGVFLNAGGTLNNDGGTVSGNYDVAVNNAYGFVESTGQINGGKLGVGMTDGGRVINAPTGSITGTQAISISGGAGQVYNEGTINAGATGFAVNLAAGFNNILTVSPGAVFIGTVTGGNTVGATNTSQLQLQIGSIAGTIGGFGTQFVDFNQIYVQPNANWSITSGTIPLNTTFGVQAAATLTNLAAIQAQVTLASYYTGSKAGIPGPEVVNASGGTIGAGTVNSAFGIYDPHTGPNGVTLPADTIINDGTINAATGVKLVPQGVVTNQAQGVIQGNVPLFFKGSGTVTNQGLILSGSESAIAGIYLGGGGTIINQTNAGITGPRGVRSPGYVKVENYGGIDGFGGTIPLPVEGSTSAARAGVLLGSGFVTNGSSADIKGPHFGIGIGYKTSGRGTVVNAGTISAYFSGLSNNAAVYLFNGGQVTNQPTGLITAVGTGNVFGVRFHGVSGSGLALGTLINQGSIAVPAGFGFYSNAGGAVSNTGTGAITALAPIKIQNGTASIDNQGLISGSTSANAAAVLIAYGYVLNEAKGTITAATGVELNFESGSVTNKGVIAGNSLGAGVYLAPGGLVTNGTSARISGEIGVSMESFGIVVNSGSINGISYGISLADGGAITNKASAEISGTTGGIAVTGVSGGSIVNSLSISGGTFGISLATGGSVTNFSGGNVTGGALGIGLHGGGYVYNASGGTIAGSNAVSFTGGPGTVRTFGYINGSHNGTVGTAVTFASGFTNRLAIGSGFKFLGNIVGGNTAGATSTSTLELMAGGSPATLTGLGQYFVNFANFVVDSSAVWTLAASGSIASGTTVTDGGSLTNDGKIFAPVTVSAGATLANAAGASISGTGFEVTATAGAYVQNAGMINLTSGGGNGIVLAGGASLSNISGGTITASTAVYASGSVSISNSGQLTGAAAGGYGVSFKAGGTVTNFGSIAGAKSVRVQGGNGTITNYGMVQSVVQLAAGYANQVAIAPASAFKALVDGGNTISAASTSTLELMSGSSAGSLVSANYTHFSNILVDQGAIWTLGTGTAIQAGSIVTDSGTLTNNGTVLSPVFLAAGSTFGGALTNATGATISAGQPITASQVNGGQVVTLTNFGTVSGTNTLASASGVALSESAQVTNQANALIRGARYGVLASPNSASSSTITNNGSIIADGASGAVPVTAAVDLNGLARGVIVNNANAVISASGAGAGVVITDVAGTYGLITNYGTISGYRGITSSSARVTNATSGLIKASGQAVSVTGSGTVLNQALITSSSSLAVGLGVSSLLTNQSGGTIQGRNGISVGSGGTVVNYGLIAGTGQSGYSVNLAAGAASRLIVQPGATFVGAVNGGNTIGATARSTLELASGASAGTLTGLGSQFTNFASVSVDINAQWTLTGQNSLAAGSFMAMNGALDASGAFLVDGSIDDTGGGTLTAAGGRMIVENAGNITNTMAGDGIEIGHAAAGGAGEVDVTGAKAAIDNNRSLFVGDDAQGTLNITGGGTVIEGQVGAFGIEVGVSAAASGSALEISGIGSKLEDVGTLDVGVGGAGALDLSAGGVASLETFDAGVSAAGIADVSLAGAGTELFVTGNATVADDGTGVLSVLNGATFAAANLTIGSQGDSSGALVVSGAGSQIDLTGSLNVGTALGTGDLTIGKGATVMASVVDLQGEVVLEGGVLDPTVVIDNAGSTVSGDTGDTVSDFIIVEGTFEATGAPQSGDRPFDLAGTIAGGGTLTINGSSTVTGPGLLLIASNGTMEINGAVLNAATTTFTDNLMPAGTYSVTNSVVDVSFLASNEELLLDDIAGFGGTVTTYHAGDVFAITGGTLAGLNVVNGNTLTFSDTGTSAAPGGVDSIIFGSAIDAGQFSIVNGDSVDVVACFAAGTWIETPGGPVAVEDLGVGDRVLTWDGHAEPVVWIGQRTVNCARHPRPRTVWPVRVRAGAFGRNVPRRDLYLSPDHAVFVNGVLVPVKLLGNGTSIAPSERDSVTYFHVELPCHHVILAEGLAVESYLDTGDRAKFDNGGGVIRLFASVTGGPSPDAALWWEAQRAAQLVVTGPLLAAARQVVAARATRRPSKAHEAIPVERSLPPHARPYVSSSLTISSSPR